MYERRKRDRRKQPPKPPIAFIDTHGNKTLYERRVLADRRGHSADQEYLARPTVD